MVKKPKAKRLIWDLEILPYEGWFWDTGQQYVSHHNVTEVKTICSAAWGWWGERKVDGVSLLDHPDGFSPDIVRDDEHIIRKLHPVLSEADILIGHNIKRFDLKQFNTRALDYGLGPIPPKMFVDTLEVCRKNFAYPSNSLDYVAQRLGCGGKLPTPQKWWLKVLAGDEKAMKEVFRYNKGDVHINRNVYGKILPYAHNHPNINAIEDSEEPICGKCGSNDLHWKHQYYHTAASKKQVYWCLCCLTHGNSPINLLANRPVNR